jgi:vitamin B12 transporter
MFRFAPSRSCGHPLALSLLSACALLATTSSQAQNSLSEVVITATRSPLAVDQSIGEVTVIDRTELERSSGRTLAEVLAREAGLQITANGGLGKTSAIFLRGLEPRHVLLLVDGVRYGSATSGQPSLDNLPIGLIERIEIVRSPLSGLYGSDAAGGVIQVFTRRAQAGSSLLNGSVTVGSHGYRQAQAGTSVVQGDFSAALQLMHTRDAGFSATNELAPWGNFNPDTDGFQQNAGSLSLGLKLPGQWQLDGRLSGANAETAYDDGSGVDARAGLRNQVTTLQASGPVMAGWRTVVRIAESQDDYKTFSSASSWAELGTISTHQRQLSWENTIATPIGQLLVLGERLEQTVIKPVTNYDVSSRTIESLAVGLSGQSGAHSWQGNLRRDQNSQFGQQSNGTLGYGYQLAKDWRLSASTGTSFVAPSFNQLYWPGWSSPTLQPEQGRHSEIGLRWSSGLHQVQATLFGNRIRGYIVEGANPTNLPYAVSNGLSLSWEGQLGAYRASASAEHIDPRNDDAGSTHYGKQLIRRARNSGRFAIDRSYGAWTSGMSMQAIGERWEDSANTDRLPGYVTADLFTQWQFSRDWMAQARLNNLADQVYETARGYNQPGRELFVTLRYVPR